MDEMVLIIDGDQRVIWANATAHRRMARAGRAVEGRSCCEVLRGRHRACSEDGISCPMQAVDQSWKPTTTQLALPGPDGKGTPHLASFHPVPGPQGELLEFVVACRPTQGQQDGWRIVQEQSADLALLHSLTEMSIRGCSLGEILRLLAQRLRDDLGCKGAVVYLAGADGESLRLQSAGIHPRIKREVEKLIQRPIPALEIPLLPKGVYGRVMAARRPVVLNGPEQVLAAMAEHTDDPAILRLLPAFQRLLGDASVLLIPMTHEGAPVGLFSTARDTRFEPGEVRRLAHLADQLTAIVLGQRMSEERGRMALRQELLLEAVAEGIIGIDRYGRTSFANPAALALLGRTHSELQGRKIHDLCGRATASGQPCPPAACTIMATLHNQRSRHDVGCSLSHRTGRLFPIRFSAVPLPEPEGGIVVTFRDVSETQRAQQQLRRSMKRLRRVFAGTVQALSRLAEMRDPYTAGHQRRVAHLARTIAQKLGLDPEQVDNVRLAATIHDIGKHAIPVEILTKPGGLAAHEMELIRTHSVVGWEILREADFPGPIATIVRQHHERLDGSGYPDGLRGDDIHLESRIIAVADVVEAISSHRPYRPAKGLDEALREIFHRQDAFYDSDVVACCTRLFRSGEFSFDRE